MVLCSLSSKVWITLSPYRRDSWSRDFLPTATIFTSLPWAIRLLIRSRAARMTLVEKPPARPLSAVATTIR